MNPRSFTFLMMALAGFALSACRNNDYFKDDHNSWEERMEDRRDRKELRKEEGKGLFKRTGEWWDENSRRMDREVWGDF